MPNKTIYEMSSRGRKGVTFPVSDVPHYQLPNDFERRKLDLPELSELDVVGILRICQEKITR